MKSILTVCLLVWGCQGLSNDFESTNQWLETFLTTTDESPTDCYTEKQEVGQWVKLSECMDSNNIDLEKTGFYRESSGHNLKICCPRSRLITTGTEILPPMPKQKAGCGWSNPGGFPFPDSSKTRAKFGEFPWMVALMKKIAKTTRQKVPKELRLCKFLNIDCLSVYDPDSSGCTVEAPLKNTDLSPKEDESPTDCYTEKKEVGQWVKLSECMDSNNIDLEKTGVYRESSGHNLKICCPRSRLITTGTEILPPMPKQKAGCGWSNPGCFPFPDSSKTRAKFGEFPWMVALMKKIAKTTRQKVPKELRLCKFLNIDCLSVYDPDSSGCTVEAPLKNTDLSLKKGTFYLITTSSIHTHWI
ncbi:uncharacterized protein LOC123718208 isoform X1 [Pieris brassicae]|uniref:uncharacterized protein LOC123718208 isoform X1 n=2 Tax=Pieris brassicae TaxID=7116 RepID=UPI001E65FC3B|nr:uncharacterized protein LOC123718208 isoform X1 [Pieris brassicae]